MLKILIALTIGWATVGVGVSGTDEDIDRARYR